MGREKLLKNLYILSAGHTYVLHFYYNIIIFSGKELQTWDYYSILLLQILLA